MKVTCEWRFAVLSQGVPELSEHGDVYELGFGLGPEHPPTSALIKPEYRRKLLYHMSPQQVFSILFYFLYVSNQIFFLTIQIFCPYARCFCLWMLSRNVRWLRY